MRWAMIGVGNMGEALLRGLLHAGVAGADDIVVADPRLDPSEAHALGVSVASTADAVRGADVVVLAVKPQTMPDVLATIGPSTRGTVISIAAGVTLATLEAALPAGTPVIRAMPNTPCLVGAGASAFARGTHADPAAANVARQMLGAVGIALEVDEADMDAVTALSGSGPAYVFALLEAMIAGGVAAGLAPDVARRLATQTVLGAARLADASEADAAELRRRVTSPGGTTAAALAVLGERQWSDAMVAAIVVARNRGRELGK